MATDTKRLLMLDEAAAQLGCTRRHMYALISRGLITSVRMTGPKGNPWGHRIEQDEVDAYIERNRTRP